MRLGGCSILRVVYMNIKKLIRRLIHSESYPNMRLSLRDLRRWGFKPMTAVDVGAYTGEWTTMFKSIFSDAEVLMIEPQLQKQSTLEKVCSQFDGTVHVNNSLLGAGDDREVDFIEMETGSSVFEENSPYARHTVKKKLSTLDRVVRTDRPSWNRVDFLKLDVQGYEVEVLKGSQKILKEVEFILLEASLVQVNKACPLIDEVIAVLGYSGFRLLDFCSQIRRKDGVLWQTDLIFVNQGSRFVPAPELNGGIGGETNKRMELTKMP